MSELFFKILLILNREIYESKKIDFKLFKDAENYILDKMKVQK